jgi:5-methylcytosine-specific restriction endonuclease McrA
MINSDKSLKVPSDKKRSSKWPALRKAFIKTWPQCAVCRSTAKLEVHHIIPFHIEPSLELLESNLITLCENQKNGVNCHLLFGHLGNYKSYNKNVKKDCHAWLVKLRLRPK